MNTKRYLQILMAAKIAKSSATAMDGTERNNFNGFVDMEAHDRRFHNGHYEEGQTCKLRQILGERDNVDMIAPEANNTTHEQVVSVLSGARDSGLLDDNDHRALMDEYNAIRAAVEVMDGLGDSTLREFADRIRDFNAVYNSLAAMNQEEQPQPPPQREPEPQAEAHRPASPSPTPAAPGAAAQGSPATTEQQPRRVPPIQRLVGDYRSRLVSGFPTNNTAKRRLLGGTSKGTVDEAIRALIDHPENPQYRGLLDYYTDSALRHPTSWAGRLMGTIERLHPEWLARSEAGGQGANAANYHGTAGTPDQIATMRRDNAAMPMLDSNWTGFVTANRQTTAQDKAAAATKRLDGTYSPSTAPKRFNMARGCNCWKTVMATLCRIRGFNVKAKSRDSDEGQRPEFRKSQKAMCQHYERINLGSSSDNTRILDRIANGNPNGNPPTLPYPNGTFISIWSGGHCTGALLWGGKFYAIDPWHDSLGVYEYSSSALGGRMKAMDVAGNRRLLTSAMAATEDKIRDIRERIQLSADREKAIRDGISPTDANGYPRRPVEPEEEALVQGRLQYKLALRTFPPEQRSTVSQEDVIERAVKSDLFGQMNGSFVIKPTDPLIPEIFQLVERA